MHRKSLMALALASGLLAGCALQITPVPEERQPSPTGTGDRLAGTSWTLTGLHGQPLTTQPSPTLVFAGAGQLGGSDGCNRYSGPYSVNGSSFLITRPLVSTRRACPPPLMEQADAYLAALSQAASFAVTGQQLALLDANNQVVATFAAQSTALAGTRWEVVAYNNGRQAVVSVISGTQLTINFGSDGRLSGSAGCNNYSASYETDNVTRLHIGLAVSTMMACGEPVGMMEQETRFLQALATVASYRLEGSQLQLRTADGAIAVNLRQAQPE
jgi:heat shock protein HslJ